MNTRSIESRVIALDAVVKALLATHPDPQPALTKFSFIYQEAVRELNTSGSPEKTAIAKELMAECDLLSNCFPKT